MAEEPNPRRFAFRAALLVLPVVALALVLPRVYRTATAVTARGSGPAPAGAAGPDATGTAAALGSGIGALTGAAAAGAGTEGQAQAAPRRDGPTVEQIEASRAANQALLEAQQGWRKVEVMAPRDGQPAADGERVVPFQGFGLQVDSTPSGASVTVDGRALGVTPLLTSVACRPGDPVVVEVALRQRGTRTRQVRCRADQLVSITIPLGR